MNISILNLVFALAVYGVVHLLLLRIMGASRFIRNAAILMLPVLFGPWFNIGEKVVFISAWNMYVFALVCARNSVSLRILDELLRTPGEALEKEELLRRFSDTESLSARIDLMEKNSFLKRIDTETVALLPKAVLLARGILFGRWIFGVRNPG